MANSRGQFEWAQTSCLMALVANMFRDPKKSKLVKPADFNPYLTKEKPIVKAPLTILRDVWCRKPSAQASGENGQNGNNRMQKGGDSV